MQKLKTWLFLLLLTFIGWQCNTNENVESKSNDSSASTDSRPNIILLVADDHGKDAIGAYGNPIIQTPNLDKLAASGTLFNRAFCTTASCSASRSVILSGLHNHANGHFGHQHSYHHFSSFDNIKSFPVLLEENGYRTGRIGKYHVAPEKVYHFNTVFKENARSSMAMANKVTDFINEPNPFFLYFCFSDPHRGGGFAEELPLQPDRFGNIPEGYPEVKPAVYDPADVIVPPFLSDTPETRAEIAQYYQSISRLDQGVGRLFEILESSGKWDNTMIIYISDNGMAFPGAKTTLYEAGMNLPCIVKAPDQKNAQTTDALVNWTDLAPTIMDVAGIPNDSLFHGQSFKNVLDGEAGGRESVFASHTFHEITMYYPMRVLRGDRYKLIVNLAHGLDYPFASDLYESKTWQGIINNNLETLGQKPIKEFLKRPLFELYDLEKDPWETRNLASDLQYQEILQNMRGQIQVLQENTKDPWIYKWTYE
ncbi:MAG: sulfatase [Bacteroidota bacterium]